MYELKEREREEKEKLKFVWKDFSSADEILIEWIRSTFWCEYGGLPTVGIW